MCTARTWQPSCSLPARPHSLTRQGGRYHTHLQWQAEPTEKTRSSIHMRACKRPPPQKNMILDATVPGRTPPHDASQVFQAASRKSRKGTQHPQSIQTRPGLAFEPASQHAPPRRRRRGHRPPPRRQAGAALRGAGRRGATSTRTGTGCPPRTLGRPGVPSLPRTWAWARTSAPARCGPRDGSCP